MLRIVATLCSLMIVGITEDAIAQQWTEYRPDQGGYRIEMPGAPQISNTNQPTQAGLFKVTSAVVELSDRESIFFISLTDYPPNVVNSNPSSVLDHARDGAFALIATGQTRTLAAQGQASVRAATPIQNRLPRGWRHQALRHHL
jgi:hypothetical protein